MQGTWCRASISTRTT